MTATGGEWLSQSQSHSRASQPRLGLLGMDGFRAVRSWLDVEAAGLGGGGKMSMCVYMYMWMCV